MLHELGTYIIFSRGPGPADEEGPSNDVDEDFNTDLDELLRRDD